MDMECGVGPVLSRFRLGAVSSTSIVAAPWKIIVTKILNDRCVAKAVNVAMHYSLRNLHGKSCKSGYVSIVCLNSPH